MKFKQLSKAILIASLGMSVAAHAAPIGFSNVNDFKPGNFNVITFDPADERDTTSIVNKFSDISAMTMSGGGVIITNTPASPLAGGPVSGDYRISWGYGNTSIVRITFSTPVDSVGAFFGGDTAAHSNNVLVTFTDNSTFSTTTTALGLSLVPNSEPSHCRAINGFIGIDGGGKLIKTVTFREGNDAASLDSIYFGTANGGENGAGQSPMPSSLATGCTNTPTFPSEEACLIYGVNDAGLNNSQLFAIDADDDFAVSALGETQEGADIEGLAINSDGDVFASSGDDTATGHDSGHLFQVNTETGAMTAIGSTGFNEVSAISFSSDDTLWGWADGQGLIEINTETGAGTLRLESEFGIEDVSWNNDSSLLYGVAGTTLYEYNPATSAVTEKCTNFPSEVEAIDTLTDGSLVFALHSKDDNAIHAYDIDTCSVKATANIETEYSDIEGIASSCN